MDNIDDLILLDIKKEIVTNNEEQNKLLKEILSVLKSVDSGVSSLDRSISILDTTVSMLR